jgi:hypothetical protein
MQSLTAFALQIVILAMVSVGCRSLKTHSTPASKSQASLSVKVEIPRGLDKYGYDGVAILKAKMEDGSVREFRSSVPFEKSEAYVAFDRDTAARMVQMGESFSQLSVAVVDREGRLLVSGKSRDKSIQIIDADSELKFHYDCRVQECASEEDLASHGSSESNRIP